MIVKSLNLLRLLRKTTEESFAWWTSASLFHRWSVWDEFHRCSLQGILYDLILTLDVNIAKALACLFCDQGTCSSETLEKSLISFRTAAREEARVLPFKENSPLICWMTSLESPCTRSLWIPICEAETRLIQGLRVHQHCSNYGNQAWRIRKQ